MGTLTATGIDTSAAGVLTIGGTTATSVSIGRSGQATNILGTLTVAGNETESGSLLTNTIDTSAAGTITIGGTTATNVSVGRTGQTITMLGTGFYYTPNTTYTPVITATTTAPTWASNNIYGSYSVIGKTMFLKIWYNTLTAGASNAGSGNYGFSIPSGYTINQVAYNQAPTLSSGQIVSTNPTATFFGGTCVGSGVVQNYSAATPQQPSAIQVFSWDSTRLMFYIITYYNCYIGTNAPGGYSLTSSGANGSSLTIECILPLV